MASQILNHTVQALDRLVQQFKDQPQIVALVTALTSNVQEVETALWQLLVERTVNTAVGVHLDKIGKIVGQPRNGLDDETYRRYIRARIATNRSRGTIGDVLRIARLVLADPDAYLEIDNQGAAAYVLRVKDVNISDDLAGILIEFLRSATSASVRAIVEYHTADPFVWGESEWEGPHVWARAID